MTVQLARPDGRVILRLRAEGGGSIGDASFELKPGESAFGRSYAEWAALPEGPYEIPDP